MHDVGLKPRTLDAIDHLHMATSVGRGNDGRIGRANVGQFGVENAAGRLGLEQIVDTGAAATHVWLVEFHEVEARNLAQQVAGLLHDLLPMAQMA